MGILFKACSKCHGDLITESDSYGTYLKCMQCAKYFDLEENPQWRDSLIASRLQGEDLIKNKE